MSLSVDVLFDSVEILQSISRSRRDTQQKRPSSRGGVVTQLPCRVQENLHNIVTAVPVSTKLLRLYLVDLAGSEKVAKTGSTGEFRRKEISTGPPVGSRHIGGEET